MSTTDWHPADIVAAIRKTGTSLRELSIQNGLGEKACQVAIHRPYTQPESVIARALGLHPKEIWPSRYHADGERKRFLHSKMLSKKTPLDTKNAISPKTGKTNKCLSSCKGN